MHRVPKCLDADGPFSTLRLCTLRSNRKNSGSLFRPSTRTRRRHQTPASTWSCWGLSRWEGDPHPAPSSSVGHKQHPVTNWRALVCDARPANTSWINVNRVIHSDGAVEQQFKRTTKLRWSVGSSNLCCEQNKFFRVGCQSNHKIMVASGDSHPLELTEFYPLGKSSEASISLRQVKCNQIPAWLSILTALPLNPFRAHYTKLSDSILSLLPVTHLIIET